MAQSLRGESGKSDYQRLRAYLVMQFFMKNADERHPVSMQDILLYLNEDCGISADRRAVYKDIDTIKQIAVGARWERKGMVFSNPTGGYLSYRTVYDCFKRITRSIGLEVRFHELRHAYASLALQGGDDIKTVQENLGHATPEFTMKVYAHANQTMKKNSAARMENTIKTLLT